MVYVHVVHGSTSQRISRLDRVYGRTWRVMRDTRSPSLTMPAVPQWTSGHRDLCLTLEGERVYAHHMWLTLSVHVAADGATFVCFSRSPIRYSAIAIFQ